MSPVSFAKTDFRQCGPMSLGPRSVLSTICFLAPPPLPRDHSSLVSRSCTRRNRPVYMEVGRGSVGGIVVPLGSGVEKPMPTRKTGRRGQRGNSAHGNGRLPREVRSYGRGGAVHNCIHLLWSLTEIGKP